ncbi:MAG: hypothetical protein QXO47_00840 [Thermoproteota archaeon]
MLDRRSGTASWEEIYDSAKTRIEAVCANGLEFTARFNSKRARYEC